jgi:fructoselysine 6-kinase
MKILAMTGLCIDFYPQYATSRVGGNSLNVAVQCRRSGAEHVALLGPVGHDIYAERVEQFVADAGLDGSHIHRVPGRTASNINSLGPDGDKRQDMEIWDGGVSDTFRLSEEDWAFVDDHDAVVAMWYDHNGRHLLERPRGAGSLAMDFFEERDADAIMRAMAGLDLGFANGSRELAERLEAKGAGRDAPVVVTLGREGSVALAEGRTWFQEAIPVDRVVDSVGCGDAYMGAFIVSWLLHRDVQAAMRSGAEAGAACAARLGAV